MASVVTATAFELVDKDGNRRALLGTNPDGVPALQFYRADGAVGMQVGLTPDEQTATVILYDEHGHQGVSVTAYPDGGGLIQLRDAADIPRAVTNVKRDGTVSIELHESRQRAPVWIRLHPDGMYDGSFERKEILLESRPNLQVVGPDKAK